MLSKPLANGGLNASNATTAAMQFAAQLNASNGQVTPLLFGNDASAGGGFGISLEAQAGLAAARRGGLYVDVTGTPPRDVPNNAVTNNEAGKATRQVKTGVSSTPKNNGVDAEVLTMINQVKYCNSAVTCADTSRSLMTRAGIYTNTYAWAQSKGDFNAANTYLGLAATATALSSQASQKINVTIPSKIPYEINASPFAAGWNTGEYSAGLSGLLPMDMRTQAQIDTDQARIGKFAFGTVMIATGVGIYGLPTLGAFSTGAAIGGTVSAGVQYTTTGKVGVADTVYGGLTGGLTLGQTIIPSLVINTGGAISSSAFSTDSASSSAAGAVAGTTFGAGVDTGLDSTLKYLPNNKYTQPTKAVIQVLKPVLSGAAGEFFGNAVKDKASQ